MRVGIALPVAPELNEPRVLGSLVRAAEGVGFSSLWVSDHLLLPPGEFIPHGHQPRAACERAGRAPGPISARVSPPRLSGDAAAVRADLEAYGEAGAAEIVVSLGEDGGPAEVLRRWAGFAARAALS